MDRGERDGGAGYDTPCHHHVSPPPRVATTTTTCRQGFVATSSERRFPVWTLTYVCVATCACVVPAEVASRTWRDPTGDDTAELPPKFEYEEEGNPEEFFVPYVALLLVHHCEIQPESRPDPLLPSA